MPRDNTSPDHETWLAAAHARAGRFAQARELLDASPQADFDPFFQSLRVVVEETLKMHEAVSTMRNNWFRGLRIVSRLRRATQVYRTPRNRVLERIQAECARQVLRAAGHSPLALWILPG